MLSSLRCFACALLCICGVALPLAAQQPASATTRPVAAADEPMLISFALSPERSSAASDTLPELDFRMYDPSRRQTIDWGTLGNLGSAARPLLYETQSVLGFNTGVRAFDLYKTQPGQLGFYRSSRTFSDVYFSQGRNQFETNLNARFSRTFSSGANFSLAYKTLSNIGQYRYQRDKHDALALGIWVPKGTRYDGFLIFTQNVARQQDNGGIVSDEVFGSGRFSGPVAAQVRMPRQTAKSRLDDRSIQLTQHLKLLGNSTEGKRTLRLTHSSTWNRQKFKFTNPGSPGTGLGEDASFFNPIFLTDQRGLRHFAEINRWDNSLTLNTFKAKKPGRPSDLLAAGISHAYINVNQEPVQFKLSNLFLTGKISLTPSESFAFEADGALGLLKNIGEYQLRGSLNLSLGKAGLFKAQLLSQRRPVGFFANNLYVSKRPVWQNEWSKVVENTLAASYSLPLIGFEATAQTHLVNNYLYYDQGAEARQTSSPLQVAQLVLRENLRWGKIRFDNTVALQRPNRDDVLRLPQWFSKNSLYFSGMVFRKKMLLNAGVDFRMNAEFRPDAYQPLLWQFHLQDSLTARPYPWADVFFAFKVNTFMGFIRYENVRTLFQKDEVFYQTAYHPQPFGSLRFGIAWRFMDSNTVEGDGQPNTGGGTRPTGFSP
jgi:hypothetical protein